MDDQSSVSTLLRRAADTAGSFEPPSAEHLASRLRKRTRLRTGVGALSAAAVVAGLAVGLQISTPEQRPTAVKAPTSHQYGPTIAELRTYRWRTLPPAPIAAREEPATVWTGRQMLIWGGVRADGLKWYSDGASYDPATRAWQRLPPAPLAPRADMMFAWAGGRFLILGGDGNHQVFSDGASYAPATRTWTKIALPVSPQRSDEEFLSIGRRALLLAIPQHTDAVRAYVFDPADNGWRRLPDLAVPLQHHVASTTAVRAGRLVYVWTPWSRTMKTGENSFRGYSGVDAYALDPRTGTWRAAPLRPTEGTAPDQKIWTGHDVMLPDETLYCGACSPPFDPYTKGVSINPRTGARADIPSMALSTQGTDYAWTGRALLAAYTQLRSKFPHLDARPGATEVWNPTTNSWSAIDAGRISPLNGSVSAWTGRQLLIWGVPARAGAPSGYALAPG